MLEKSRRTEQVAVIKSRSLGNDDGEIGYSGRILARLINEKTGQIQEIEGHKGESYISPVWVKFTADSFFTHIYGMESGFRSEGFPNFNFLDAVAFTSASWELYEKRRQAESDAFWNAFVSGLANGGGPRAAGPRNTPTQ